MILALSQEEADALDAPELARAERIAREWCGLAAPRELLDLDNQPGPSWAIESERAEDE